MSRISPSARRCAGACWTGVRNILLAVCEQAVPAAPVVRRLDRHQHVGLVASRWASGSRTSATGSRRIALGTAHLTARLPVGASDTATWICPGCGKVPYAPLRYTAQYLAYAYTRFLQGPRGGQVLKDTVRWTCRSQTASPRGSRSTGRSSTATTGSPFPYGVRHGRRRVVYAEAGLGAPGRECVVPRLHVSKLCAVASRTVQRIAPSGTPACFTK